MANETGLDSTGISDGLAAFLRKKSLAYRYAASKVWNKCLNGVEGDANVKGIFEYGNKITFQKFPALTVYDVSTTDGAVTDTEVSPTAVSITINKWKSVSANIVDIVSAQHVFDWKSELAKAFGEAISQQQDDDVLALVVSLGTNIVGGAQTFGDGMVLQAQRMLDDAEVPKEDRTWCIAPVAQADLLAMDKFTIASATGFSKGLQVEGGRITGLYGTPVVVSSRVTTTTGLRDNVLFHKECFGIVMQKNFKIETMARTQLAQKYIGSALYGVAELRDDHGVWVKCNA